MKEKAPGQSGITRRYLREMSLELALHLVYIYNAALSIGHFPPPWKTARVVMIPKKESTTTINEYQPISLLKVPGKIFEKLLNQRVAKHMEDGQLYNSYQFGFRSRRGCQDAIALGYEHMTQEYNYTSVPCVQTWKQVLS